MNLLTTSERFAQRITPHNGCLLWKGAINGEGYGTFKLEGKNVSVHRLAWFLEKGEWPVGSLDHTCHNKDQSCPGGKRNCLHRRCVNVEHLEEVTNHVNVLRSPHTIPAQNAAKTHCLRGHAFDGRDSKGKRSCSECGRQRAALRYLRKRSPQVGLTNDIVALKHIPSFVPSDLHSDTFESARADQVADRAAP